MKKIVLARVVGWLFLGIAFVWFAFSTIHGGHLFFRDAEINLRDPVLILNKTMGLSLLGLLLLGKKDAIMASMRHIGTVKGMWWLTLMAAVIFASFSLLRHYIFGDPAYDVGLFEHFLYRLSKGSLEGFVSYHRVLFGDHLFLLFYPYSLIYRFTGMAGVMVIHKAVLASVVPFSFLLGKALKLDNERTGFLCLMAVLAPAFFNLGISNFYVEGLIFPIGVGLLWAFYARRPVWIFVFSLAFILIREDAGIALGFIFVFFALVERKWRWVFLGLAAVLLSLAFMQVQTSLSSYAGNRLSVRYGISSFLDVAGFVRLFLRIISPKAILAFVIMSLGFGVLPFLSWRGLLTSYLSACPNLASNYFRQAYLRAYYPLFSYSVLFAGVAETLTRLKPHRFRTLGLLSLASALLLGPRWLSHRFDPGYLRSAYRVLAKVPKNDPLAATSSMASLASARDTVYVLTRFSADSSSGRILASSTVVLEETDVYYRNDWQRARSFLLQNGYTEKFSGAGIHLLVRPTR